MSEKETGRESAIQNYNEQSRFLRESLHFQALPLYISKYEKGRALGGEDACHYKQ